MSPAELTGFALRALTGHRLRSLLSLTGVTIGVAAVVVLTALGEGARRYVVAQFTNIGSNLLLVLPGRTETTGGFPGIGKAAHDLTLEDAHAVARQVPSVRRVAPLVVATEMVSHGERRRQVAIIGTNREFMHVRNVEVTHGEFLPPGELPRGAAVVVLGSTTARELFPGTEPLGQIVRLAGFRARVIGVLAARGQQLGMDMDDLAILPVATAMRLFNRTSLFRLMVQVGGREDLDLARREVLALLTSRHDGEEDVTILTQDAVVGAFSAILSALTLALAAIAAVSLAVAGIGIMNVMLVSVAERTREVGLLKALGAGRRQILLVFLAEAALLSFAGGLLGVALGGLGVRILVGFFPALPASPPLWAILASLALAATVGVAFGLLPARRAARLDPVVALARR